MDMTETAPKKTTIEHLTLIANSTLPEDTRDWAKGQLALIEKRKAKRAEKPSKTAEANAPIKTALIGYLNDNKGKKFTEVELGAGIGQSHNKAGSLARQLVGEGVVNSAEVKIPKVGTRKVYWID